MNNYYKNKYPIYIYVWMYGAIKKPIMWAYKKIFKR